MAYYNHATQRSDVLERVFGTIARYLAQAAERRAIRRVYRSTLTELQSLSNRELADLGLRRTELKRIAWEAAHGAKAS